MDGLQSHLSNMELSPTSSPRRRATTEIHSAVSSTRNLRHSGILRSREIFSSPVEHQGKQNRTPLRPPMVAAPSPYMSPTPQQVVPHNFIRTQSSPCIIDASPKWKHDKEHPSANVTPSPTSVTGATFSPKAESSYNRAELTPVTRNTAREASDMYDDEDVGHLVKLALRPVSPPSWPRDARAAAEPAPTAAPRPSLPTPSYTTATAHGFARKNKKQNHHVNAASPEEDQIKEGEIHDAALEQRIRLDRNSLTFGGPNDHQYHNPPQLAPSIHRQAPDNMVPYQPERDSRLASFGIVRDDAQGIFLNNNNLPCRSGQHTSEMDDFSDFSIPSIHLATQLHCSTIESCNSVSYDDDHTEDDILLEEDVEDDNSMLEHSSSDEDDEIGIRRVNTRNLGDDPLMEPSANGRFSVRNISSPPVALGLPEDFQVTVDSRNNSNARSSNGRSKASSRSRSSRTRSSRQRASRMLTPEKEREVYEWLHSLEVDKDNNDYVAEAASSKFLTGKVAFEDDTASDPIEPRVCRFNAASASLLPAEASAAGTADVPVTVAKPATKELETMETTKPPAQEKGPKKAPPSSTVYTNNLSSFGSKELRTNQVMGRNIALYSSTKNAKGGRRRTVLRSCSGM